MSIITLQSGSLSLHLNPQGGAITGFWQQPVDGGAPVALMRPLTDGTPSCFPMVPFGNRVRDNHFSFDGRDYHLEPNTDWDRYYLHGEGWQVEWSVTEQKPESLRMQFEHRSSDTGYLYQAWQRFVLSDDLLEMTLGVKNLGDRPMPFGIGFHPYFSITPQMTLWAPVQKFWQSTQGYLPDAPIDAPADVDFCRPQHLPHRWVDNGLQGWLGKALISWPEWQTALHLEADPLFRHAFIFVPRGEGGPTYGDNKRSFGEGLFCFEPMSHLANGQNLPNLGDLTVLSPGEELSGSIRLRPQTI